MNTLDALYPRQVPTKDSGYLNGKARGGNEPESDRASQFASALSAHGKTARAGLDDGIQEAEGEVGDDPAAAQTPVFRLFSRNTAETGDVGETKADAGGAEQVPAEDMSDAGNVFTWPALDRPRQDTDQKTVLSAQPVSIKDEAKAEAQPAGTPAEHLGNQPAAAPAAERAGPVAQPAQSERPTAFATISGAIPGKAVPGSATTDKRDQTTGSGSQPGSSSQSRSGTQAGIIERSVAEQAARNAADISQGGKERPGPVSPTAGERVASREENGGRMERVHVVESRSFAGMTSGGNGEAVARTLLQELSPGPAVPRPAALTSAAAAALFTQPLKGQTLHTLKIQLNPVQLGQVTAVMRMTGSELTVELKVETAEAFRQMNDDADAIVKSLRGQGYGIEHVSVQQVMTDRGATAQGGQAGASAGQQFHPGNGQSQTLASGGENGRRGEAGDRRNSTGDRTDDVAANASGGTRTPDGVYL